MSNIQLRGHCPCCGRIQAVVNCGVMSKHGYTVEHGWFSGVCPGQHHKPIETERSVVDQTIHSIRAEAEKLRETAEKLQAGKIHPLYCRGRYDLVTREYTRVPYAEASSYQQEDALRDAVWQAQHRADQGERIAEQLEMLANRVHGAPLIAAERAAAPAPIHYGEKRIGQTGEVLEVTEVRGVRVYWKLKRADKVLNGWSGTQAWRKLQVA